MTYTFKKPDQEMKILIAYHAHCIDGFTSAWACWRGLLGTTSVLNESIEFMEMTYDNLTKVKDVAGDYDFIYFVDFSLSLEDLQLISSVTQVMVIDHHKTAYEKYSEGCLPNAVNPGKFEHSNLKGARILMDLNECGASLIWKHFFPAQPLPTLIQIVRDYDLWRFEYTYTKAVNKYLRLKAKKLSVWQKLESDLESLDGLRSITTNGSSMLAYHDSIVAELVEQAELCTIEGEIGLYVNCSPQFSSDVGHKLAEKSGTYGATWQQEPGGKVKWSLRSFGDYDVSILAANFGGGGHRTAAGFYLSAPTDDVTNLGVTLWAK